MAEICFDSKNIIIDLTHLICENIYLKNAKISKNQKLKFREHFGTHSIAEIIANNSYISSDMVEAVSRGLDNIGRVHARSGAFDKAIEV